jgi:Xaa-Pro dipeptidase
MHGAMDEKTLIERKERLVQLMGERSIEALILSPSMNMLYLTGFNTFPGERLLISILDREGKVTFIVPKLYEQEVREKAAFDSLLAWDDSQSPEELLREINKKRNYENSFVAIEDTMWFAVFEKVINTYRGADFVKASHLVGELRKIKAADEMGNMRKASELAERALGKVIPLIKVGMTENELKDKLEAEMKNQGLTGSAFETIIGSGTNSALPHYGAGDRKFKEGDSIVIDFGGLCGGYCSDMTRTVFVGKASEEYKNVYAVVKEAQERAVKSVKPGIKASQVDAAARRCIEESGYGEYFIHRTGHGIGMEVHEEPYITDSSDLILEPGMVFSIEPGIYLPGKFGVRIEDLVMVTETGVENLNKFKKELIEV